MREVPPGVGLPVPVAFAPVLEEGLLIAEELNISVDQDVGHHRLMKAITEKLVRR